MGEEGAVGGVRWEWGGQKMRGGGSTQPWKAAAGVGGRSGRGRATCGGGSGGAEGHQQLRQWLQRPHLEERQ